MSSGLRAGRVNSAGVLALFRTKGLEPWEGATEWMGQEHQWGVAGQRQQPRGRSRVCCLQGSHVIHNTIPISICKAATRCFPIVFPFQFVLRVLWQHGILDR